MITDIIRIYWKKIIGLFFIIIVTLGNVITLISSPQLFIYGLAGLRDLVIIIISSYLLFRGGKK